MKTINLVQPKRIVFGSGCAAQCVGDLADAGKRRILVVTSTAILPLVEPVAEALRKRVEAVEVYAAIDSEPTIGMFEAALAVAHAFGPDAVVGIGGGSALDVAKLVAALYRSDQEIREVFGIGLLAGRSLYLVCLPTTAGTGSEVSPNAILLDEEERLKKGVVSTHLLVDDAYVDPKLTVTVPPAITAATGMDAMVHCIEAYANKFSHPTVDLYALQGVRLIGAHLKRAVADGSDLEAREKIALGSLYGGLCLGPVNTAAVHALAYPLGGEFHVAHGVSNAILLPHVLRFNLPAATNRYAQIAVALGADSDASETVRAERGLEIIDELSRKCGIPSHMTDFGVPKEAIPRLASAAMTVTRLLKNNPRELSECDAVDIFTNAL